MEKKNYINKIVPVLMVLAVCFALFATYVLPGIREEESAAVEKNYETSLFDDTKVQSVDIAMDENSWQSMLDNAISEEYYSCNLTVNGVTYENVGIRPKGNTSLTEIASDNTTDRYSFKIDFGKYIDGQTCDGLDVLILNNIMSDSTYMKEYLSYDLFKFMGVNASLAAFANITVNGEEWGLYLAIEGVGESFAEREYGYSHGSLYKPESESVGGGGGGRGGMGSSSAGADLAYTDEEVSSYSDIFDNAVFDVDNGDRKAVIQALKNISEGTELETYIDVDQMLRYIAVNVVLVNLDSYFGTMLHNYYLYEKDGQLAMVPWDYNLSFAGFQANSASDAVNLAIDTAVSGAELSDRPMIAKLLEVEEYKEKYHQYLQEIVTEYFNSGYFSAKIDYTDALIASYVKNDATAFYTYEEYKTGIDTLLRFGLLRSQSIQGQLDGTIPSTEDGQREDPSNLVDASTITISDMGTQGRGVMGVMTQPPGQREEGEAPEGERLEETAAGKSPAGEMADRERPDGEMPNGERPFGESENKEHPDMKKADGETADRQWPDRERPNGQMPGGEGAAGQGLNTQYSLMELIFVGIAAALAVFAVFFVRFYKKRKFQAG